MIPYGKQTIFINLPSIFGYNFCMLLSFLYCESFHGAYSVFNMIFCYRKMRDTQQFVMLIYFLGSVTDKSNTLRYTSLITVTSREREGKK